MLVSRLHHFLIPSIAHRGEAGEKAEAQSGDRIPPANLYFWFSLSLTFAVIYAVWGLDQAFGGEYVVQDDARQHVFWMRRFLDPDLFANDLIANYFQSTAPTGYTTFYYLAAKLGIDPLWLNKLLPLGLGLLTTAYCFGVCLQMLPVPAAGFIATLLLNQNLWLHDDLISGIARAFVFPIFLAFLYYLLRRSLLPCLVTIALQAWFYPQLVFIMSGVLVLRVLRWQKGLRLSGDRRDYWLSGLGLTVAFAVMLPYALESSPYAPIVTVAAARTMAEFQEQGRTRLFVNNFWEFWLTEDRTGMVLWVMPLSILSIGALPLMLRLGDRLPLVKQVRHAWILGQVGLVSLLMFFAAHALLFTLYLPSRYTQNTWQIMTALSGAIAITVGLDALLGWAGRSVKRNGQLGRQLTALAAAVGLSAMLLFSPTIFWDEFPGQSYIVGEYPGLYQFFAAQPKDSMIASLAREADNLPTFAQRSILTSREYSIPYHLGYYRQIYQRTEDLIRAQYSPDLAEVQDFIRRYGVDFWLIDRLYLRRPASTAAGQSRITMWLQQFQPTTAEVTARLDRGATSVIRRFFNRCLLFEEENLAVLSATCIAEAQR